MDPRTTERPAGSRLLTEVLREQRRRLAAASGLFVSHQLGEVLVPVVAGAAIDRAIATADPAALVRWLALLAVVFAVLSTSWRSADRLLTASLEEAAHRLRLCITARFLDDTGVADTPPAGEVVSVATNDVDAAVRILVAVAAGVASSAALVAAAVILLVISPVLGAVVLVGLPLAVGALQILTGPLERRAGEQRADAARAAALATDLLTGLRALKGVRAEHAASARYRSASRRALAAGLRASRLGAVHEGGTVFATGAFVAAVALVAGRLAADGGMSIGGLVAAVGVTQFLIGPLWRIGFAAAELAKSRASARRLADLLAGAPAVSDGHIRAPAGPGEVVFRSVAHRGVSLDLRIHPGRFIAIAVVNPADASAIIGLLARREDPIAGELELDGSTFRHLRLDVLRRQVLVASHDAALFAGSVLDNVAAADPDLATDRGRLLATLAAAGAADLAQSLSDGVDTPVGARGVGLSGGQRQRVALARALAADPAVLVLHDPTTAVDPVTEHAAAEGLRNRRAGQTTIVITTSPALLAVADEVVVIADGVVVDRGAHAELLGRSTGYAELVLS